MAKIGLEDHLDEMRGEDGMGHNGGLEMTPSRRTVVWALAAAVTSPWFATSSSAGKGAEATVKVRVHIARNVGVRSESLVRGVLEDSAGVWARAMSRPGWSAGEDASVLPSGEEEGRGTTLYGRSVMDEGGAFRVYRLQLPPGF